MKYLQVLLAIALISLLAACGAGHKTLTGLQISPQQATASSGTQQAVDFTAQGTLSDNSTRELTTADGLQWASSNALVASIDENTGHATCKAPGTVTITATAPADLQLTINNGIHNTSPNVRSTAALICT